MNIKEEMAKELLKIIQNTNEGIVKGIEIATQQMPEIIDQIINFSYISIFPRRNYKIPMIYQISKIYMSSTH